MILIKFKSTNPSYELFQLIIIIMISMNSHPLKLIPKINKKNLYQKNIKTDYCKKPKSLIVISMIINCNL